ncbi:hypothetical protein [Mesorhizobium sp. DCY119]|uniref:hypothetical protein n=1 Tax=Mesorhizobium sp. DCY119 TaxID=2108445 RepID=UPI000E719EC4|nr:hypothetical protein [Mesorhizobium sp. DCY119]RJG45870.1 hypothetical protein D3Y55_17505 [Mesorhizobium sp. DCY119]
MARIEDLFRAGNLDQPLASGQSNPFSAISQGGGTLSALPQNASVAGPAVGPSSRIDPRFAGDGKLANSGWIGNMLFGGNETKANAESQRFSGAQQQAVQFIREKVDAGTPPQKAILDFVQTPQGMEFMTSGGGLTDLANVAKLATKDPTAGRIEQRKAIFERNGGTETSETYVKTAAELAKIGDDEGSQLSLQMANALKQSAGTNVTVNNNQSEGESEARKRLGQKIGEQFDSYLAAGAQAGSMLRSMGILTELSDAAPTGPITGRLAQRFPGFSDAGAAFEAEVSRLLPSLRVPGSGAQSDKDIDVLLQGLPALRNNKRANQLIIGSIKLKAEIDRERSRIVEDFTDGLLTDTQALKEIRELDGSIIPDELQSLLDAVKGQPAQRPLQDMSDEELERIIRDGQ